MTNRFFVTGDEYGFENGHLVREENGYAVWMVSAPLVAALGFFAAYGVFGGRGWLAGGLIALTLYVFLQLHDHFRRCLYVMGSLEYRLRLIEKDTSATFQDIDFKNERDREAARRERDLYR